MFNHFIRFFFFFSLIGYFFIYISNVIPLSALPSRNHLFHSLTQCLHEGTPTPTHPLPLSPWHSSTLGHWAFIGPRASPFTDAQQGPILCYICDWSCGLLYVYSLVGGLVPRSSEWIWLIDILVTPMRLQTRSCPNFHIGVPMLSPVFGYVHVHLYWSNSGRVSQGTIILGSCQ